MSQTVHITYFGMDGIGKNITEAKKQAGAKLEAFVKDAGKPWFGTIHGVYCAMWRAPEGWSYDILFPDGTDHTFQRRYGGCGTGIETRPLCEQRLRYHLAQMCYTAEAFDSWLAILSTDADRTQLREDRHWQEDYQRLRAAGHTDSEAHQLAQRR